jgi:hypothetical protein
MKYQTAKRGTKISKGPSGLDTPVSAARGIGFTKRHSIKAGPFFLRI